MDKIYTAQEVADKLKIKKTTVYELIKRGDMQAKKVGKQLRISQQQLDQYLGLLSKEDISPLPGAPATAVASDIPPLSGDTAIRQMDYLMNSSGLIISSQESALVELLRSQLEHVGGSLPMLHSYMNDYNSLYSLYYEKTHLALVSLCPMDSLSPEDILHSLLPGMEASFLHLCDFPIGFYVRKGNPKRILQIEDLTRAEITIANREKGSCCRMLLDFLLKNAGLSFSDIHGYKNDVLSNMSMANAILAEKADVGLGSLGYLTAYPQLEGVLLESASTYLVFSNTYMDHPAFQAILSAVFSEEFQTGLAHLSCSQALPDIRLLSL
ncbi:MAG: substrate-binding domain-containing protein [Blautia sp.]|jgi:putative molybdopterin biosynthesis protein